VLGLEPRPAGSHHGALDNWPTVGSSNPVITGTKLKCLDWTFNSVHLSPQKSFRELLCKQNGDRALWEYPFAVAGVNITFMLIQMLDLEGGLPSKLFRISL
jgi:hypothetical protein